VTLKARRPPDSKYPKQLNTLGDHIRKRRLDLGLFQKQLAEQIGVSEETIYNWESNECSPQIRKISATVQFFCYKPLKASKSEGAYLARRTLGLTQKQIVKEFGVDPTSARWERGNCQRSGKFRRVAVSKF
jgi:DNA-binding XRE family transcriptional regulator